MTIQVKLKGKLVSKYEFEQMEGLDFSFCLEVYKRIDAKSFYGIVLRRDTYRIMPSFPQKKGKPKGPKADVKLWSPDSWVTDKVLIGKTEKIVLDQVTEKLLDTFASKQTDKN